MRCDSLLSVLEHKRHNLREQVDVCSTLCCHSSGGHKLLRDLMDGGELNLAYVAVELKANSWFCHRLVFSWGTSEAARCEYNWHGDSPGPKTNLQQ